MHRNIARAYDCLQHEHDRVRAACIKIMAQNDKGLERELLRANLDSPRHHDEILLYEERLSRPQQRRVLDLNRYGRKIERIMGAFAVELLLAGVPIERVSVLLGHQSVRITEKHYAPWVRSRQEQLEADLARAWSRHPQVLSQGEVYTRGTLEGDDSETSSISTGNTGTRRGSRAHGVRVISILPFEFCKPRAQAPLPIVPLRESPDIVPVAVIGNSLWMWPKDVRALTL